MFLKKHSQNNYIQILLRAFKWFNEEEILEVSRHFHLETFSKGEKITHVGEVVNKMYIIETGIVKQCVLNEEGLDDRDETRWFTRENQFITISGSFLTDKPAKPVLVALTNCRLWSIKKADLKGLYKKVPQTNMMGRLVAESYLIMHEAYLEMLRLRPEDRIKWFYENHAELVDRVPMKYVASYLHLRPETLSRVRKKMAEDKDKDLNAPPPTNTE